MEVPICTNSGTAIRKEITAGKDIGNLGHNFAWVLHMSLDIGPFIDDATVFGKGFKVDSNHVLTAAIAENQLAVRQADVGLICAGISRPAAQCRCTFPLAASISNAYSFK